MHFLMTYREYTGLKSRDFKKLLRIPDSEILGEVIRLNCTVYSNGLDVIKVCTYIKESRIK